MTRIAVSPLLWANDDLPELGGDTPVETILDGARDAGYAGVELGHAFPRDAATLGPLLEARGLALASGWWGSQLLDRSVAEELEAMQEHRALLRALGVGVTVLADVSRSVHSDPTARLSDRPVLDDHEFERLASALIELGRALADDGIRLAYHHHVGTVIESESEIDRLMALTERTPDAVYLLLDTGHVAFGGGDAARVARRHGERVAHVHLKDVDAAAVERAREGNGSFLDAVVDGVFRIPGEGAVDFPAVLGALGARGYDGWLVVEADQDPATHDPNEQARRAHAFVATRAAAALWAA